MLTRYCPADIEVIARLVACVALLYQLRQRDPNLVDSLAILLTFCHAVNRQEHVLGFTRFDFDKVVRQVRRYSSHGNDTLELILFFSVKLCRINIAEGNLLVLQLKVAAIFFKVSHAARIQLISQLGFQGIACIVVQVIDLQTSCHIVNRKRADKLVSLVQFSCR